MPRLCPQIKRLTRFAHVVTPVASDTLGGVLAPTGVRALQVMVLRCAMTTTAYVGHLIESRRGGPVGTVTRGAVWRPKVLVVEQRIVQVLQITQGLAEQRVTRIAVSDAVPPPLVDRLRDRERFEVEALHRRGETLGAGDQEVRAATDAFEQEGAAREAGIPRTKEQPRVFGEKNAARLINANLGFRVMTAGYGDFDPPDDEERDQYSQEFQLTGNAFNERMQYVAGLYWFNEQTDGNQQVSILGPYDPAVASLFFYRGSSTVLDSDNEAIAVFSQVDWEFNDNWRATVGLRYTEEDRELERTRYTADPDTLDFFPQPQSCHKQQYPRRDTRLGECLLAGNADINSFFRCHTWL